MITDPAIFPAAQADSELAPRLKHGWLTRYRDYRVFSWPWLWRRMVLFGLVSLALCGISSLMTAPHIDEWGISAMDFLVSVGKLTMCCTPAPLLACWVRSRRWSDSRENAGVIVAVLVGALLFFGYVVGFARPFERRVVVPRLIAAKMLTPEESADLYGDVGGETSVEVNRKPGGLQIEGALVRTMIDVWIYLLFGGGLAASAFFREKNYLREQARQRQLDELRLQVNEADMQLMVLQAQIEPHFLFNTLASLRSFIHDDSGRATTMVDALVDHLRATIPQMRDGGGVTTLVQQLAICRSYLEVMKLRMNNRLEYSIEVPAALLDVPFPPLMLLTLVENAIKHGIEPKRGAGTIRITAERRPTAEGPRLRVQVADDGAGLRGGMGHGVGLSNIRSQLALRYRGGGRLSLEGRTEGGAVATLEIPEAIPSP